MPGLAHIPVSFHVTSLDATAGMTRRRAVSNDAGAMGASLVWERDRKRHVRHDLAPEFASKVRRHR